jgi:hypothetical protein
MNRPAFSRAPGDPCPDCDGTGEGPCATCGDGPTECACDDPEHGECDSCDGMSVNQPDGYDETIPGEHQVVLDAIAGTEEDQ